MNGRRIRITHRQRRRAKAFARHLLFQSVLSHGILPESVHEGVLSSCPSDPMSHRSYGDGITNHNGRIDGDNGDGKYETSEYFTETSPNKADTDGDGFTDSWEIGKAYDPLNKDTDHDGINDNVENFHNVNVLDADETDPKKADTDGDGLDDPMEIEGWTIVIIYEATKEQKTHYIEDSDPRDPDTDNDGLTDLQEYCNVTDPRKSDSDGDGKTDTQELTGGYDSSPTGIDRNPPTIWKFECNYEIRYDKWLLIEVPSGLNVEKIIHPKVHKIRRQTNDK